MPARVPGRCGRCWKVNWWSVSGWNELRPNPVGSWGVPPTIVGGTSANPTGNCAVDLDQWAVCTDPDAMLRHLRRRVSNRKLRLFACACYRHVPKLFKDRANQVAV